MEERIREQCIYCGGEIVYSALEKYVKCRYCGKTFSVLKFRSEQAKIKRALEEGEKAKAALVEAERRRQEAQDRLNRAVADLTGLREGQDTLSRLMQALADTQTQSDEKLALLQNVAARLLETQDDVLAKLDAQKEIVSMLHGLELEAEERRRLEADFIAWSQSIHEDDCARLERIQGDAAKLLSGQDALNERVDALRQTVDESARTLSGFHNEYQSDKVKALEQLYRQAEDFQRERRFDRAAEAYRQMIVQGGADVAILWRLVMCRYCLEYQKDENDRLIPIILRPDLTDASEIAERRELLAHIKPDEAFYREELTRIDAILDKYREVRHKVHYDVFISVKQNVDGHHTPDSDVASDLYDYIKRKGLRVFNSRRTPIPAGQEYEPYIISALMSAKVLIVVGTKPEYMNAQWVRNEWSRFQWLQRSEEERSGHTDRVLFCYLVGGMSPKKIPKALNPDREAIIDGVNATERLDVALAFLLPNPSPEPVSTPKPRLADDMSLDGVLRQMTTWLHNGQFAQVTRRYNELTDQGCFLNSARLHIYALCAQRRVHDVKNLIQSRRKLEDESLYQLARKLCDNEGERAWLEDLAARNREYRKGKLNRKRRAWIAAVSAALLAITGVVYFAFLRPAAKPMITPEPTEVIATEPTERPTPIPTALPTEEPTPEPTEEPTPEPTEEPTPEPTEKPTPEPTEEPTPEPTEEPTPEPTEEPTPESTEEPAPESTEEPIPEWRNQRFDVGSKVEFGHYEQDNNTSNGTETIEWIVLENDGETATLISRCGLDSKPYNTVWTGVTWETCSLRYWLNNYFLNTAFTKEEQARMEKVTVTADSNPNYTTDPGNNTQDKVFLLSIDEVNRYYETDDDRVCMPTQAAMTNGAWTDEVGACWWWLRSSGRNSKSAARVKTDGSVFDYGNRVIRVNGAVRPVVVLRLQDLNTEGNYDSRENTTSNISTFGHASLSAGSAAQSMASIRDHQYALFDIAGLSWDEAERICESYGGYLVCINTQEEQLLIESMLKDGSLGMYWIGGFRKQDDVFEWIDGSELEFTNWDKKHPADNWLGVENCLQIMRIANPKYNDMALYTWNDAPIDNTIDNESFFTRENVGFICEWSDGGSKLDLRDALESILANPDNYVEHWLLDYLGDNTIVNCDEWVSMRQYPDKASQKLKQVPRDATVTECYNTIYEYALCKYNGIFGFVHKGYLSGFN